MEEIKRESDFLKHVPVEIQWDKNPNPRVPYAKDGGEGSGESSGETEIRSDGAPVPPTNEIDQNTFKAADLRLWSSKYV